MDCPHCSAATVAFPVSERVREGAPDGAAAAAICTRCLTVAAAERAPDDPDFSRVSDAFPDGEAGATTALVVGLLDSLAMNRTTIETLLAHAEERGIDVLLVLDRLADDPDLDPVVDLRGRRRQLEQLL